MLSAKSNGPLPYMAKGKYHKPGHKGVKQCSLEGVKMLVHYS